MKKNKLSIIRIVGNNLGGGARINVYMANQVLKSFDLIEFIPFIPKPKFHDVYTSESLVPFNYVNSIHFFTIFRELVSRAIFRKESVILFLHLRNVAILWGLFCILFNLKYAVFVHAPNLNKFDVREKFLRILYKIVLERANKIVFVSNFVRQSIQNEMNILNSNIEVIPNGSDKVNAKPSNKHDDISFVIVGELTPRKGIFDLITLIETIAKKSEYSSRVKFHIYGEGELAPKISVLHAQHSFVHYYGYEPNTSVIYNGKSHLLMLSKDEAFGRVITEGASIGLVPVLRKSGGFIEISKNLEGTFVFTDVQEILHIIDQILGLDQTQLKHIRRSVIESYQKHYSADIFEHNLKSFIRSL